MADDPAGDIETLRERIQNGERDVHCDDCREKLIQYSDNVYLIPSKVGDYRHRTVLRKCTRLSEHAGCLAAALDDEQEARKIVRWIHQNYEKEYTNQTYRSVFRSFGKHVTPGSDEPETMAWISYSTSNDHDPTPSERDLLKWESDVQPMLEACQNPRDRALIAVQFEAGCRPYELEALTVGDIFDGEHATGIHVDGKTGERAVHLIISVPYLQAWLNEHPAPTDADAPLWSKLDVAESPSYNTFLDYFKSVAKRAGVSKPVTPRNFRKSNTRWLVIRGMKQSRIEERQGRKQGSEHTRNYLARFGDESNEKAYARLHGVDVGETEEDVEVGPVECHRCHRETPRERDFCMWCHAALSYDADKKLADVDDDAAHSIADSASPDTDLTPEEALELRDAIEENPVLKRLFASLQ
ncbi:tyrosine-type recombinase/integrase [Haloferax namakaokahaiae]|uniref:Tyrosine-type recombinase/integrase n=1 Tax=Haloferax namakaokahaiae TaxID=1748331 RepID=A0ABD5ZCJ7_9EURY